MEKFNVRSIFPKSGIYMSRFFEKLAENSLFAFSVKDIKTRKICLHNKKCAEIYGLGEAGLVGMTSRDCLENMPNSINRDDIIKRFEKEEEKAIAQDCTQTKTITILDYAGIIRVREHLTIPVSGARNKIIAIAAICTDLTSQVNLLDLFQLYQRYYPTSIAATRQIAKYLNLAVYFRCELTAGELYILFAMIQDTRHKQIAHLLTRFRSKSILPSTVAKYVDNIKIKLRSDVELHTILYHLRDIPYANRNTPFNENRDSGQYI